MKKQEPILTRVGRAIGKVWRRFPEGMVCLAGLVAAIIVGIALDDWQLQRSVVWIIVRVLGWGMIVGVNWRLAGEAGFFARKQGLKWGILATVLGTAAVYGLGSLLFNLIIMTQQASPVNIAWWAIVANYWQMGLTLILLLGWLIMPNLRKNQDLGKNQLSENSSRLLMYLLQQGVLSGLFGGVMNAGLTIALVLVGWLFDWDWWEAAPYISTVMMVGFTTTYFLATFPEEGRDLGKWEIPKIWKVLLFYIAAALMLLYDLIIYVYLIWAAVRGMWPEGGVVNLILWFGMLAVLMTFLIGIWTRDAEKSRGSWQEKLTKIFSWSLVPLAIVAAMGMGIRIWDQGWTMNRWLVVMGLMWIGGGVWFLNFGWWEKRMKLWNWSIVILAAGMIGGPVVTQLSQRSRLGADWLQVEQDSRRGIYGFDEEDDTKVSFAYSTHSGRYDYAGIKEPMEISNYDWLLVPREGSSEVEIGSSSGRMITYQWLGAAETVNENGLIKTIAEGNAEEKIAGEAGEVGETGEVGRLQIKIDGQIVYDFDWKNYIAELNAKCEQEIIAAGDREISKYDYGCDSWKEVGKGGLDESAATLQHEMNGVTIDYRVRMWQGDYNLETDETTLHALDGLAFVKI